MANRNPERDRLWARDTDKLSQYVGFYVLVAHCQRMGCEHERELHPESLLRRFGKDITLGDLRARLRCFKCQTRRARLSARFLGPRVDGRH